MGLGKIFGGKDDAVSLWKRDLLTALKDGDLEQFRFLLRKEIDAPPAVLDDVMAKAVKQNQLKITRAILETGGRRTIDNGVLRQLVYDGKTDMFRLLVDHGWDFARAAPGGDGTAHYLGLERLMSKEYEVDRLKAELDATKAELSAIKKAYGVPEGGERKASVSTPASLPKDPKNPVP